MSSSARPSARDAELEALRANSIVGRQRSQLNSAPLPNMTMDSWYEQQRNLSKEEQRKKMEAASQLHSYRGKEIPVTKKREPLVSPKFAVLADGASLPPGPDAPQEDVRGKDVRGIVTSLETTKRLPSLEDDDNVGDVETKNAKSNGAADHIGRAFSKMGVIDGESTISVAEEIKKYSKPSTQHTDLTSGDLGQPTTKSSESASDPYDVENKEREIPLADVPEAPLADVNSVNNEEGASKVWKPAEEPTDMKGDEEIGNKENTRMHADDGDIPNVEAAVASIPSDTEELEEEVVAPLSITQENEEQPTTQTMSSQPVINSLPSPAEQFDEGIAAIQKLVIDDHANGDDLLTEDAAMTNEVNDKASVSLIPHLSQEEASNSHDGAVIPTLSPEKEEPDEEEQQSLLSDMKDNSDFQKAEDSAANDVSESEPVELATSMAQTAGDASDLSNEKYDSEAVSTGEKENSAIEASPKVSYAQVVGKVTNATNKKLDDPAKVMEIPAVSENPPQQNVRTPEVRPAAAVATSAESFSMSDNENLKKIDVKVLLAVHVKQSDGDAVVQGRGKSILESVVGVTERIVKETLKEHREKDLPETYNKEAFRLAVYKDDHRPYVETVSIDPDFKNAPKGIVRLVVREVVCIFEPKSISKKDAGQVIGVVADALRNSVANGRFAKEAKALRKAMKQKAKH